MKSFKFQKQFSKLISKLSTYDDIMLDFIYLKMVNTY